MLASELMKGTLYSMEWSVGADGVECWSGVLEWSIGVESNFGVKKWAALSAIQTKPGHNLEIYQEHKLSFCRCGCEFLSDLIDLYFWDNPAMAQN